MPEFYSGHCTSVWFYMASWEAMVRVFTAEIMRYYITSVKTIEIAGACDFYLTVRQWRELHVNLIFFKQRSFILLINFLVARVRKDFIVDWCSTTLSWLWSVLNEKRIEISTRSYCFLAWFNARISLWYSRINNWKLWWWLVICPKLRSIWQRMLCWTSWPLKFTDPNLSDWANLNSLFLFVLIISHSCIWSDGHMIRSFKHACNFWRRWYWVSTNLVVFRAFSCYVWSCCFKEWVASSFGTNLLSSKLI